MTPMAYMTQAVEWQAVLQLPTAHAPNLHDHVVQVAGPNTPQTPQRNNDPVTPSPTPG
jgi:hypothetical protein